MRAVVVTQPGGPEALQLAELPDPVLAERTVVVDVEAAGVNPVDIGNRADPGWAGIEVPYVVGYEFSGRVREEAAGFSSGDAVWGVLPVRGRRWGAYAEQVAVPVSLLARRPVHLDPVEAACFPLAGLTALQVLDRLSLQPGSTLLVHGAAGGVGQLMVQFAVARGLRVAAASRPEQRELVTTLGVELWHDRSASDVPGALAMQLRAEFDAVADLVGGKLFASLPVVREGGSAATIVDLVGDFDRAIDSNITVHGVLMRPGATQLDALASEAGQVIRPKVRNAYPIESAADAHRRLEAGGVDGKVAIAIA